jgi:hypothetical protein
MSGLSPESAMMVSDDHATRTAAGDRRERPVCLPRLHQRRGHSKVFMWALTSLPYICKGLLCLVLHHLRSPRCRIRKGHRRMPWHACPNHRWNIVPWSMLRPHRHPTATPDTCDGPYIANNLHVTAHKHPELATVYKDLEHPFFSLYFKGHKTMHPSSCEVVMLSLKN